MKQWVLAACTLAASAVAAQPHPEILEIAFEGNDTTQPQVMLREMFVRVGDPADPDLVERSRQGVQDLGLFRGVEVRREDVDGGVRLVFRVREKWYILPLPRLDANSDGGYAYGVQLVWSNVWGLNHTFAPYAERRQASEGDDDPERRGVGHRYQLRYTARNVFDSPYNVGFSGGKFRTPFVEPFQYEESSEFYILGLRRRLSEGPGSQGWSAGTWAAWRNHEVTGRDSLSVSSYGKSIALGANADYYDVRFNLYSDSGLSYGANVETAGRDYGSDYQFTTWNTYYAQFLPIGDTPHQTLHFKGWVGSRHGGAPGQQEAYSLGGAGTLRGFEPETREGDAYWLASVEYLRPLWRNSIRALVILDAGDAFHEPGDSHLGSALFSAGIGVRVRIQAFVNIDIELGVAWPLNGGEWRVFAGSV